jgi:Na+-translocating ferredoxin:NAD+ oxidoreductase RnfD subunit
MGLDLSDLAGCIGAALVVIAYLGNQQGWLPTDDRRYPLVNLIGALLILASLYRDWNLPAAVIEAFWAMISLYGLAKQRRIRSRENS